MYCAEGLGIHPQNWTVTCAVSEVCIHQTIWSCPQPALCPPVFPHMLLKHVLNADVIVLYSS